MQCTECGHSLMAPSLLVAMEQRQHVALVRNAEACNHCAGKMYDVIDRHRPHLHAPHCSLECTMCCKNSPIMRLRFDVRDRCHAHIAVCEKCYSGMRDELLRVVPGIVGFIEKEWNTGAAKDGKRLPYAVGTRVRVKSHVPRWHGTTGRIASFRGLVQPWFGYDVRFDGSGHHFFHERDLEFLGNEDHTGSQGEAAVHQA